MMRSILLLAAFGLAADAARAEPAAPVAAQVPATAPAGAPQAATGKPRLRPDLTLIFENHLI